MSVDKVPPTPAVPVVHLNPDANGKPGRDPRRDGKPGQAEKDTQDRPEVFVNDLGQPTGKTINITA